MPTIAFLHTADVHVATFDRLLSGLAPDVQPRHAVRSEWLAEAGRDGMTAALEKRVAEFLTAASQDADAVVCTCSTLGPIADAVAASHPNVLRVDRPMMEQAARCDGTVLVALCLESTLEPTLALLRSAYRAQSKPEAYAIAHCKDAWRHFERGDCAGYGEAIAAAIKDKLGETDDPGCVVLAQASMAAAEPYLDDLGIPVYSSPKMAITAALALVDDR